MKRLLFNRYAVLIFAAIAGSVLTVLIYSQTGNSDRPVNSKSVMDHENCPMMKKGDHASMSHFEMVKQKGEKEMGFSQSTTTHHFILANDGGAIRIDVNDVADTMTLEKVRGHLKEIAGMFASGDFATPFAIHRKVPPGVPAMAELRSAIAYTFEETDTGAQVRISTKDVKALSAIHDFLRFQIEDHQTGDPIQ
jgi:hypothetical protein